MENLNLDNISLHLHVVGGHSLMLKSSDGKRIIKASSQKEIEFYEYSKTLDKRIYEFSPVYYGKISKSDGFLYIIIENFKLIEDYLKLCCIYFKSIILNKYSYIDFNIEKDEEFKEKFDSFLKIDDNGYNKHKLPNGYISKMFEYLDEYLSKVSENKIKWIVFSFIKWNHLYLQNDFIVIENLLSGINEPAIIDFKLGKEEKVGKEKTSMDKIKQSTSHKYGFRIMGCQSYHKTCRTLVFKDKYYCRKIKDEDLHKEIIEFFTVSNTLILPLIKICINKLKEICEKLQSFKYLRVPYSSILIIYDVEKINITDLSKDNELDIRIKLIDFGFFKYISESYEIDQGISLAINNLVCALETIIEKIN